jgi:hypothetical protein
MSATNAKPERANPCKKWPECACLYGKQEHTIPPVLSSERGIVLPEATLPRGPLANVSPSSTPTPTPAPKVKVIATVSFFERIGRIETRLDAISNDLAKGMLTSTLANEEKLAEANRTIDGLKAAAAAVKAMPKLAPEPPKPPKAGDTVWLKSSGKGPFVLIGEIPALEIDVGRVDGARTEASTKRRYTVEGFTARWVGSGKAVALPKEDVTTIKPVFPTLVGRAVKYAFVGLGLTTLLTAQVVFGRMAIDRMAHGPDNGIAPVKTSTNH